MRGLVHIKHLCEQLSLLVHHMGSFEVSWVYRSVRSCRSRVSKLARIVYVWSHEGIRGRIFSRSKFISLATHSGRVAIQRHGLCWSFILGNVWGIIINIITVSLTLEIPLFLITVFFILNHSPWKILIYWLTGISSYYSLVSINFCFVASAECHSNNSCDKSRPTSFCLALYMITFLGFYADCFCLTRI